MNHWILAAKVLGVVEAVGVNVSADALFWVHRAADFCLHQASRQLVREVAHEHERVSP